ncbi:hypothetical protein K491DRAFT_688460 [Lophiostoma macrostomum CBS 122681]|uniref:Uncharacterized protein n=1 Tax=Lophiostoma macrostomum CBS 122681 TaxID=1314788 RepID=A0A6A6TLQ5_9PLEO|nr:hypothetical protein K491DRAFT_688460 [Lophiostoma macrostomum CBS 122681]
MYSQHKQLAKVWTSLQRRHDIASILHEIIGQHVVVSLDRDGSQNVDDSIRIIIWIKTVLDLQRGLLSGTSRGVTECPSYVLPCILPSELLLSTVFYLVDTKTRAFPRGSILISRNFRRLSLLLAQTLLSGLRLVSLKKVNLDIHDTSRLRVAINAAWQYDRLDGVEQFIVSRLFAEILDSLNAATTEDPYQQELVQARIPTYASGLYPLDVRPEVFVTPLVHGLMEEDWIYAYWVLFDCLWAVEIALTQRIVDLDHKNEQSSAQDSFLDTDEMLEQLYHQRSSLILSIFHVPGPMMPDPEMLASLAITLLEWNEDLDSFLSRQDSLLQQRSVIATQTTTSISYGKNVIELTPYFADAMTSFSNWLLVRTPSGTRADAHRVSIAPHSMQDVLKDWISRTSSANSETATKDLKGSLVPYVVDCPKLHVVSKELLAYRLRWCDKWAFEAIEGNSPNIQWKEGVQCPSCSRKALIKHARLIEPLQRLTVASEHSNPNESSLGSFSTTTSSSYGFTSSSSQSMSDAKSSSLSPIPHRLQRSHQIEDASQPSAQPPCYSVSPIDSAFSISTRQSLSQGSSFVEKPVSPLNESLNIPIPLQQRLSMDLPIPVVTPFMPDTSSEKIPVLPPSESASISFTTPSPESSSSNASTTNIKSANRTGRFTDFSMKRKPTSKSKPTGPLPPDPQFAFSASGHSLLLWGKLADHVVRLDIPSNDPSAIQGCKYEVSKIEAAACGNHKCAVLATSDLQHHRLVVFDEINPTPTYETAVDLQGRITDVCVAVSRNDNLAAISANDEILIFRLNAEIKPVSFHHQIHAHEVRGGSTHRRTIPIGRTLNDDSATHHQFGAPKGLSTREAAEEQRRQTAIVSRKVYFSPDSAHLVVATQLGDHCVYIDVWDCTQEPVRMISEHSRSFRLPPFTLNDGDLTSVFYDSLRRCAIVTAFLGKEYPLLIPFPLLTSDTGTGTGTSTGYEALQNETYSTKIVHAAQSASGIFVAVNAMTEIVQFEFNAKGVLSPRRLKRVARGVPNSAFKPGAICLSMPRDDTVRAFWIKEKKCVLRTVRVGTGTGAGVREGEGVTDVDLRGWYDRLVGIKGRAVIKRAESLRIAELGG